MTVMGKPHTERKDAGRALMKEILTLVQLGQEGEVQIASIGGFDVVYVGEWSGRGDDYRYQTLLKRTGADFEIDLAVTVTPLGAISRLEHTLGGFTEEQHQYRQRLDAAQRRLASYRTREGGSFAFVAELAEKRQKLRQIDEALAKSEGDGFETEAVAA